MPRRSGEPIRDRAAKLHCCGRVVSVLFLDGPLLSDGVLIYGITDPRSLTIRIGCDDDVSRDRQRETLMHEVFHAVIAICGGNHLRDASGDSLEEGYVRALETGYYDLTRDRRNLWYVDFMQEV